MIFRDHYLFNSNDALEAYYDVREYLNLEDYKIVDWNMCFPLDDLDDLDCFLHVEITFWRTNTDSQ